MNAENATTGTPVEPLVRLDSMAPDKYGEAASKLSAPSCCSAADGDTTDSWIAAMDMLQVLSNHLGHQTFFDLCREAVNRGLTEGWVTASDKTVVYVRNTGCFSVIEKLAQCDHPVLRCIHVLGSSTGMVSSQR